MNKGCQVKNVIHYIWMIKKLVVDNTNHIGVQFLRYGFVAVAAFVVDFGLFLYFDSRLRIYSVLAATMSFLISLVLNYYLSTLWVFSHSTRKRSAEVSIFLIVNLVGLGLNDFIIWVATSRFSLQAAYAKLVAVAIVFFWSFFSRRYFIFRHEPAEDVAPNL